MGNVVIGIIFAVLGTYEVTNLIWWVTLTANYTGYPFNWRVLVIPVNYIDWAEAQEELESESSDY